MALKKIEFESVDAQVLSIEHISRVLLRWRLSPTTQNLTNTKFFIYRGESPSELNLINNGELSDLEVTPIYDDKGRRKNTEYEFLDYTPKLKDLHKAYYYRVDLVEYAPPSYTAELQRFKSKTFSWDGKLDLVALYVIEEHLFLHRWVTGVPVFIYKKKNDGERCPNCWDTVLQRVTKSNCQTCYGTGRMGGYYAPIIGWMTFDTNPDVAQVAQQGKVQIQKTDIQFTDYPVLRVDDIILELKPNIWWKVSNIRHPEKNRNIMLQMAGVDAVNRSDIEYAMPVDEEKREELVKLLESRKDIREF